jgi:hypothetical protein
LEQSDVIRLTPLEKRNKKKGNKKKGRVEREKVKGREE